MLIPYKYTYLFGCLIFMIPWVLLFSIRKDLRKEMIVMSILMALASFISGYLLWTIDWWRPDTLTSTRVGVEDLLLGFANGGVAAVLYEELFKKYFIKRTSVNRVAQGVGIILVSSVFALFLFYFLGLTSFIASTISMLSASILLVIFRKDLFYDAIFSATLMCTLSVPVYFVLMYVSPGWIERTWMSEFLSGYTLWGIPIEDLVFYFLFGFVVGPFYELWQGYRFVGDPR